MAEREVGARVAQADLPSAAHQHWEHLEARARAWVEEMVGPGSLGQLSLISAGAGTCTQQNAASQHDIGDACSMPPALAQVTRCEVTSRV